MPRHPKYQRIKDEQQRQRNEPIPQGKKNHDIDGAFPSTFWDELNRRIAEKKEEKK